MYVVTVEFIAKGGYEVDLGEALILQAGNSLKLEDGCRLFDVCQDPEAAGRFFLYEIYDDQAAFDLHMKSDHFLTFSAKVAPFVANKSVDIFAKINTT
jgi:(4S)-4-hydroxy-5-phosphonooxypentane-2,3-dione isomerase